MSTDPDLQVQVFTSPTGPKLLCRSSCLQDRFPFVRYENDREIPGERSAPYSPAMPKGFYSCGFLQHRSDPVCEFITDITAAAVRRDSHL